MGAATGPFRLASVVQLLAGNSGDGRIHQYLQPPEPASAVGEATLYYNLARDPCSITAQRGHRSIEDRSTGRSC